MNLSSSHNGPVKTPLTGLSLVNNAVLNKGTAFTDEERDLFHLHGLLPPHVGSLDEQISRRLKILRAFSTDLERYAFLRNLQDTNETLFYALLTRNLEETLPLVYTPTVGEGCVHFSEIWHKSRGLFLSYPNRHRIRQILSDSRFDRVRVIVVSDGERILGLGDQGAGGMGIPIGKLSLYTACAGIHPDETLPILLDVGTNNAERLADPLYVGWRHERVRGDDYDAFIEEFVSAVTARWPGVLLQWEDFAGANAVRLLHRYRDRLLTFNDDIQGTAAAAFGALLAAVNVTGVPLAEQRLVILGAGAAGTGIASLLRRAVLDAGLSEAEARRHLCAVGRHGLLVEDSPGVTPAQAPFVQTRRDIADWVLQKPNEIDLLDVVSNVKPTVLIGVSGQGGAFTEPVVREMAKHIDRPIIFPLSNPTLHSEATPEQLAHWTNGRCLIGTGSPFGAVQFAGRLVIVNQTNNSYIFPGIGLGVIATRARHVTDAMFMTAGRALADLSPSDAREDARLLPPVDQLRAVAVAVAFAVARQAQVEGVADHCSDDELRVRIAAHVWEPNYRSYCKLA